MVAYLFYPLFIVLTSDHSLWQEVQGKVSVVTPTYKHLYAINL